MTTSLAGGRSAPLPARLLALAVLLAAGLLTAGCADDDPITPRPKPAPLAVSEDSLMSLFREAYTDMDLDAYVALLHDDFVFEFTQFDVVNLGLPADHFDLAQEIDTASNMFSGEAAPSTHEPGVSNVTIALMQGIGDWADATQPEYAGCRHRAYHVQLSVYRPGGTTLVIDGRQDFFAAGRDTVLPDQSAATVWSLRGHVESEPSRAEPIRAAGATEEASWGIAKWLYSSGPSRF